MTEKWVWIGIVLVALLVGAAAWEGIRPKDKVEIRDTRDSLNAVFDSLNLDRVKTLEAMDSLSHQLTDAEIEAFALRTMMKHDGRRSIQWQDSLLFVIDSLKHLTVQVFSMDTTRPIKATVTNGTDTVDALTYVTLKSEFISAPVNEFRNVQVSLAQMTVGLKSTHTVETVYEPMRGGLGGEWIQEFGGRGGFKATGYIPVNGWLSFTPSVVVGSLSGAGGGIFIHW